MWTKAVVFLSACAAWSGCTSATSAASGDDDSNDTFEVAKTVARVNEVNPSATTFYVPDMRFNRKIGQHAGQLYSIDGRKLTEDEWKAYAPSVLPTEADEAVLKEYFKNPDWIAPKSG